MTSQEETRRCRLYWRIKLLQRTYLDMTWPVCNELAELQMAAGMRYFPATGKIEHIYGPAANAKRLYLGGRLERIRHAADQRERSICAEQEEEQHGHSRRSQAI